MSQHVWTYANGLEFVTTVCGYRLSVCRSGHEGSYEFQVLPAGGLDPAPVASGSRNDLCAAVDAAELALTGLLDGNQALLVA